MKAKTKCPNCGEIIEDDCLGCITGGTLMHSCSEDEEPEVYDVKWEIIDTEGIDLTKQEFNALHLIEFMYYNNPKLLSQEMNISEKEAEDLIYSLRNKMLIDLEVREGQIYGSKLTNVGKTIWNSPEWEEYKLELGY